MISQVRSSVCCCAAAAVDRPQPGVVGKYAPAVLLSGVAHSPQSPDAADALCLVLKVVHDVGLPLKKGDGSVEGTKICCAEAPLVRESCSRRRTSSVLRRCVLTSRSVRQKLTRHSYNTCSDQEVEKQTQITFSLSKTLCGVSICLATKFLKTSQIWILIQLFQNYFIKIQSSPICFVAKERKNAND